MPFWDKTWIYLLFFGIFLWIITIILYILANSMTLKQYNVLKQRCPYGKEQRKRFENNDIYKNVFVSIENSSLKIKSTASWIPTGFKNIRVCEKYKGPGIVIAAGGPKYGPLGYALVSHLRRLNCSLPIEVWYAGTKEQPTENEIKAWEKLDNIELVNIRDYVPSEFEIAGFQSKVYATCATSLNPTLTIDADALMYKDPTYLLKNLVSSKCGAFFFQDYVDGSVGAHLLPEKIWRNLGIVEPAEERQQESCLIFLDRNAPNILSALAFVEYCADHSEKVYKTLWGDKDTWRLGCRLLNATYEMSMMPPGAVGNMSKNIFEGACFLQHDPLESVRGLPDGKHWVSVPLCGNGVKKPEKIPTHTLDGAEWNFMCNRVKSNQKSSLRLSEGKQRLVTQEIAVAHKHQKKDWSTFKKLQTGNTF